MTFVDTNILVHATSSASDLNEPAQTALIQQTASGHIAISRQIMREYTCVMTRQREGHEQLSLADAFLATSSFASICTVYEDSPRVWNELLKLSRMFRFGGKQVHDANIVATMLAYGETQLLTFNRKDVIHFEPLIQIVTP